MLNECTGLQKKIQKDYKNNKEAALILSQILLCVLWANNNPKVLLDECAGAKKKKVATIYYIVDKANLWLI